MLFKNELKMVKYLILSLNKGVLCTKRGFESFDLVAFLKSRSFKGRGGTSLRSR